MDPKVSISGVGLGSGVDPGSGEEPGSLACLAWPGLACLAWLGLPGWLAWPGLAWPAWPGLACLAGLAWPAVEVILCGIDRSSGIELCGIDLQLRLAENLCFPVKSKRHPRRIRKHPTISIRIDVYVTPKPVFEVWRFRLEQD